MLVVEVGKVVEAATEDVVVARVVVVATVVVVAAMLRVPTETAEV